MHVFAESMRGESVNTMKPLTETLQGGEWLVTAVMLVLHVHEYYRLFHQGRTWKTIFQSLLVDLQVKGIVLQYWHQEDQNQNQNQNFIIFSLMLDSTESLPASLWDTMFVVLLFRQAKCL